MMFSNSIHLPKVVIHAILEMGIIFLLQTGVGILGNSSLLCLYNSTLLTGQKVRPTDLTLSHLVLANNLVVFFRRIPQTMAAFEWKLTSPILFLALVTWVSIFSVY
uniref:Vomeronasal type-1 receptor n=1 Tax=Castor canadensis TaxID=51338 RepID=A0A8C0W666_CASCN